MRQRKPTRLARTYYWLADRLYNELAWIYDPVSWLVSLGNWDTVRKWALDYLVGSCVLEVGFGTGELLLEMARRNIQVVGLDPSAAMHRQASNKFRRAGVRIPTVRGFIQRMPFSNNSFDTIIATYPAGYIFDPASWNEVARILRSGGTALARTGGGRFIVVGIGISSAKKPFPSETHFLFGLPIEDLLAHFKGLAQSAGLDLQVVMRPLGAVEVPILIAEVSNG
jgi:ubiquinone/menaquinone biosynthesis C-methylase UbiE